MSAPIVDRPVVDRPAVSGGPDRTIRRRGGGAGVVGLVLVVAGAAMLLEQAGVLELTWPLAGAWGLVGIGVLLVVATLLHWPSGALVPVGVLLAVALVVTSFTPVDLDVGGGVGDRTERPTSVADLAGGYRLSAGDLTVDLRALALAEGTTADVEADVGAGTVVVQVPDDAVVDITARVGVGNVDVPGEQESGMGVQVDRRIDAIGDAGGRVLMLDLSVGTGEIEVTR